MADFTTSDGLRLHFEDSGTGIPLLCLSGLTRNSSDFQYVLPHLHGCRVIRLDYRGRGQSDWDRWETYTIPIEARDALELLDHLGLPKAAILGTSRGGLIAMVLAATAKDRLSGVCLVDIGPELADAGLDAIRGYIGRNPSQTSHAEAAEMRATLMAGFANVAPERWRTEVETHYIEEPDGLRINYDPALARSIETAGAQPAPDLWPLFDAMVDLPLALIRGANSDLLSQSTAHEMLKRRPDMVFADVPDRGHVPFLDEADSLAALARWKDLL